MALGPIPPAMMTSVPRSRMNRGITPGAVHVEVRIGDDPGTRDGLVFRVHQHVVRAASEVGADFSLEPAVVLGRDGDQFLVAHVPSLR